MKLLYILILTLFPVIVKAKPINKVTAKTVAIKFMQYTYPKKSDYSIKSVIENKTKNIATTYVINFSYGGFVIVSADDATIPVFPFLEVYENVNLPKEILTKNTQI